MEDKCDIQDGDLLQIKEWTETLKLNREINVEDHWSRIEGKIHGLRFKRDIFHFIRNIAAVLLLPVLVSTYYLLDHKNSEPEIIPQIELAAAYGQIAKITLPDSSVVWLNSGSKISYPQRFTGETRTVKLEGEAYFKVHADKKHRFDVVVPDALTANAYGTEFNISAYTEDAKTEITLVEGNLEIISASLNRTLDIKPSNQVLYDKVANTLSVEEVNIYVKTAWKDGKMVFRKTHFSEVVNRLSRHFNVNIELKDNVLLNYEFSATFTTETIEEILRLLEKTSPIRWTMIKPKQLDNLEFSKRKIIVMKK